MKYVPFVLIASVFITLPGGTLAQDLSQFTAVQGPVIALTNVKVIDGTGGPPSVGQTIIIRGDRIETTGPSSGTRIPAGAEILDLTGHTVIPGLIGLHNHSYYTGGRGRAAQLSFSGSRLYLASGVTTIRTTGARQPDSFLLLKHRNVPTLNGLRCPLERGPTDATFFRICLLYTSPSPRDATLSGGAGWG
mgnify:CR=1 FL=1